MVFDDFSRANDENEGNRRKSKEKQETGKKYIKNKKRRPGLPTPAALRAGR